MMSTLFNPANRSAQGSTGNPGYCTCKNRWDGSLSSSTDLQTTFLRLAIARDKCMNDDQKKTLQLLLPNASIDKQLIVPRGKLPEELHAEIISGDAAKLMLAGQRGMGKSTELRRLCELLEDSELLPILLQFGAQESISSATLVRAMAEALYAEKEAQVNEQDFKALWAWYEDQEVSDLLEEGVDSSAGVGGDLIIVKAKGEILHRHLKTIRKSRKTVKDSGELLDRFNALVEKSRKTSGRRAVFLVDDIDKIPDSSSIEGTFIHSSHLVAQIASPCVFTVPIHYATSSFLRSSDLGYVSHRVPAVEIEDGNGKRNDEGFEFMREVCARRMPFNPIPAELLDAVLKLSGGVLIDAMRLLRDICKEAILSQDLKVDQGTVDEQFQKLVDSYTYVLDSPALWQRLAFFAKATDKRVFKTDTLLPELLHKTIVIEYWHKALWFDLHPAARKLYLQNSDVIDARFPLE